MKSMRIPLIIALGVAIIGIILGSFFDLQISSAIASANNGLGLTISAIGPMIGFMAVAAMGGGFISFIIKGKYHIAFKILFGVLAAACFGVSLKYPAGEWFGINGFYGAAPEWVGYLIVLLPEAAAGVGGYFLFKDTKNDKLWIIFCIIIAILLFTLAGSINILKGVMHRPRYRSIAQYGLDFHNWWEPCKNYKDLMATYNIEKDNFKSYPSGHTAEASIILVAVTFLPFADEKFKKYQMPLFYVACGLIVIVAFARILAAAHFLSDVSTGATLMIGLTVIANEVVMRVKPLQVEEQKEEVKE
ncbi:MAG: phosphatase PAP2 family protein [Bacilli bacterium]|nr:phosphatase PAP2 family protein [Bacilli bacterium]